jgi:hypothetical protein
MCIIIHFLGCVWAIAGVFNITEEKENWLRMTDHIENKTGLERYVTSCYWAVVTMCTVGYGEIKPYNTLEVFTNILGIWFGVAFQSYTTSRVTMIFNSTKPVDF